VVSYKANGSRRIAIASRFVEMVYIIQVSFPPIINPATTTASSILYHFSHLKPSLFKITKLSIFALQTSISSPKASQAFHSLSSSQIPALLIKRTTNQTMPRPNSPNVPQDMWICGECKSGNLIALTDGRCPVCGHGKDGCCTEPGQPYPATTGLFPGYSDYQYPNTRAALPYYPAAIDSHRSYPPSTSTAYPMNSYPEAPNDLWICNECGSQNCTWCDQCPICGRGWRNSHSYCHSSNTSSATPHCGTSVYVVQSFPDYNSSSAGSAVNGYWQCPNCGGSNGPLNDYCGDSDCGTQKP
jgi:hypothetical protein